jgi:peptidoglycan/LPS O-acetylase OafA/YrhL
MISLAILALIGTTMICLAAYHLIEWWLDRKFRRSSQRKIENWRQVPPPNWRSSRGGREYW